MNRTVEPNKTLLVDGPSSIQIVSGNVEVFGASLAVGEKIVIRAGKRLPFEVKEKATFNLTLGEGASFEEVDGNTIPVSWQKTCEELLQETTIVVIVLGEVDSGKSSFCTFLANNALKKKLKVALIDADLGQSDVGPPSTIGYCHVKNFVKDPFDIEAEDAIFIGVTSPSKVEKSVIEGLVNFKEKVLRDGAEFVIVNTDGWVEGEEAVKYKTELTEKVAPNVVVGIQQKDELSHLMASIKVPKVFSVESPSVIRKRDREKRKVLRELGYKKYLKGAKVQTFPLSWIKFEGYSIGAGFPLNAERIHRINKFLQLSLLYGEETSNYLLLILRRGHWFDHDLLKNFEEKIHKKVKVIQEGEEEGMLVALQDSAGKFLGIGVLLGIDFRRKVMKVYTPVNHDVATVSVGQVKLDKDFKEVGIGSIFLDSEVRLSFNQRNL